MKAVRLTTAIAALALQSAWAWPTFAVDAVKLHNGTTSRGRIVEISTSEVIVELGATKKKLSVSEIDSVTFDAEPAELTQARTAIRAGHFDDAIERLDKINLGKVERPDLLVDIEYHKALAAGRQALAGSGPLPDAIKRMVAFDRTGKSSFHYFETCEVLGDLASAIGRFDEAEKYYGRLAAAPWPDYKLRASLLAGRALAGQKQYEPAIRKFDDVLAMDGSGKEIERIKLSATLGKATALAGTGKTAGAIKAVEDVIAQADPENVELQARAYNALGDAYLTAGQKKQALEAYLHVDLLFNRFAEQHAESLARLAVLWKDLGQADRAAQAKATLKEKYPDSTWAAK